MCGIAGVFNYGLREGPDPEDVRRMTATLTHRGPTMKACTLTGR